MQDRSEGAAISVNTVNLPLAGVCGIGAPVLYMVEFMHLKLVSFLRSSKFT